MNNGRQIEKIPFRAQGPLLEGEVVPVVKTVTIKAVQRGTCVDRLLCAIASRNWPESADLVMNSPLEVSNFRHQAPPAYSASHYSSASGFRYQAAALSSARTYGQPDKSK